MQSVTEVLAPPLDLAMRRQLPGAGWPSVQHCAAMADVSGFHCALPIAEVTASSPGHRQKLASCVFELPARMAMPAPGIGGTGAGRGEGDETQRELSGSRNSYKERVPDCAPAKMTAAAPVGDDRASRRLTDSTPMSPMLPSAYATGGLLVREAGERWRVKRSTGAVGAETSHTNATEERLTTATAIILPQATPTSSASIAGPSLYERLSTVRPIGHGPGLPSPRSGQASPSTNTGCPSLFFALMSMRSLGEALLNATEPTAVYSSVCSALCAHGKAAQPSFSSAEPESHTSAKSAAR
mmetsp:Transcript_6029/g.13982  ORF Transcript_6029/g.13982 Transcript_6029/m.13982 type:complete len:298 (+) Transcript_6029:541-1434(+)